MVAEAWIQVRLGDLVSIKHGWPFKSEHFSEELTGRPIVVNIGNFEYTGGFRFGSTTVREYRGDYPPEYELEPGDILLVMTCQTAGGEILGIPAQVPDDGRTYLHNQRLGRVVVRQPESVGGSSIRRSSPAPREPRSCTPPPAASRTSASICRHCASKGLSPTFSALSTTRSSSIAA